MASGVKIRISHYSIATRTTVTAGMFCHCVDSDLGECPRRCGRQPKVLVADQQRQQPSASNETPAPARRAGRLHRQESVFATAAQNQRSFYEIVRVRT